MPKKSLTKESSTELGNKFGRPDIERIGLFVEMPYMVWKRFKREKPKKQERNFYCEGRKTKNGTQHGYFEPVFKRIFSKEALRGRGRKPKPPLLPNVSDRPIYPPSGYKQHACPGDYYGTFSGIIEAFSDKRKKKPKTRHIPAQPNMLTNPAKKGGPGYTDIGLSPYPEHKPDRYGKKAVYKKYGENLGGPLNFIHCPQPFFDSNPFKDPENIKKGRIYIKPKEKMYSPIIQTTFMIPPGKGKWQGGCHDGCFDKFPAHVPDRYGISRKEKAKLMKAELQKREKLHPRTFYPQSSALKSYYNTSILYQNVDFRVNKKNHTTFQPTYIQYICS